MNGEEYPQFELPGGDSGLSRNEKLGVASLVVLFIIIIYLGFSQLGNNIKSPFNSFIAKYSGGGEAAAPSDEAAVMEEAKNKDTDQDGLSDYDELYIFRTSPYLADSDSDTIADKQEVEGGADPNCPRGKVCGGSLLTNSAATIIATSSLGTPFQNIPSADQILLQSILGSNPDPKSLREFLVNQGMDAKTLEKFSDTELLAVFKESVSVASSTLTTQLPGATTDIKNITPAQLRELLLKQGANPGGLKKIKDEDLMKLLREAIK